MSQQLYLEHYLSLVLIVEFQFLDFQHLLMLLRIKNFCLSFQDDLAVMKQQFFLAKIPDSKLNIYLIDAPSLYNRPGNPYADNKNQAYSDNYLRFASLAWVTVRLSEELNSHWRPNIAHSHDWHAGLVTCIHK